MQSYEVRSLERARNAAVILRRVLGDSGVEKPRLSAAQETVARLMGHADWNALVRQVRDTPIEGIDNCDLGELSGEMARRLSHQTAVLASRHGVDGDQALAILAAARPTGRMPAPGEDDLPYGASTHVRPTPALLGIALTAEDLILREQLLGINRDLDAAMRGYLRLVPEIHLGYVPAVHDPEALQQKLEDGAARGRQRDGSSDVAERTRLWDALLSNQDNLACVAAFDAAAQDATNRLWQAIQALGQAPILAPTTRFQVDLQRGFLKERSGSFRDHRAKLEPAHWITMAHSRFGSWTGGPDLEWDARTWVDVRLALRRSFLDAGWAPVGQPWVVSYRLGSGPVCFLPVRAPTAAEAVAWAFASVVAAYRGLHHDEKIAMRIVQVQGLDGRADTAQAVEGAMNTPIMRSPLVQGIRLTAAARPGLKDYVIAMQEDRGVVKPILHWVTRMVGDTNAHQTSLPMA